MTRVFAILLLMSSFAAWTQEIPLDSCNGLSIVKISVAKHQYQFLLDTGAVTTLLNLKSFSSMKATAITMESWNGTVSANGREVMLPDVTIGEHTLANVRLVSVDLTPLERSCQRRVDGVLGADLIKKLGMTIDLKNHVAMITGDGKTTQSRFSELDRQQSMCEQAFNHSDVKTFEDCLDPDIVMITSEGDFHGRKAVMKHFQENYFGHDPPVLVSFTLRGHHAIGTVIWTEYEMSVTVCDQIIKTHGTAIYQKTGDRWRMSNMNYSVAEAKK